MKFRAYAPRESLQPFVHSYLEIESDQKAEKRLLPLPSAVLSLRIRGTLSFVTDRGEWPAPAYGLTGLGRSCRTVRYTAGAANLLVRFREGGAFALFRRPMSELYGTTAPLELLVPSAEIRLLEEALSGSQEGEERVRGLERLLAERAQNAERDSLLASAIERVKTNGGTDRIQSIADDLPISLDSFEKRFKRIVGATPKQFSSIIRMQGLIDAHDSSAAALDASYEVGFFDQSHFIKAFKQFTGQTPSDYYREPPRR